MKKNIGALSIFVVLSIGGPVQAGFYVGASGGAAIAPDSDANGSHSNFPELDTSASLSYETGYFASVLAGYGIDAFAVRVEGEIFYQENEVESGTFSSGETYSDDDITFENTGVLVNLYYDFKFHDKFIPYVGVGLGYSELEMTGDDALKAETTALSASSIDDSGLCWQIGLGAAYAITDSLFVDLKYRYFQSTDYTYKNQDVGNSDVVKIEIEYATHNILLGLRYAF